jgi:serine/threonine protein kinase/tetratricopeptide (TPR) repeat protein
MTSQPAPPDEPDLTSAPTSAPTSGSDSSDGFGPYRFLQRLGEGGMGEVWIAEQLRPVRRQVAIKVVKAGMDTVQVVARFEAERQALAVMDHPTIAKVFDGGTTPEGRPYFAMEYVRGEAITSYCDRQRLPIRERLELFIQLCDGVQHAHQKGIIHRDLKPSNVLVSVSDDHPVPRIIDFGIAKAIAQPLTERPLFTELGGFLGTPEYMSPEQAELTPVDVDTRSDVYSLGVLLYEVLVGTLPFDSVGLRQAGLDEIRRTIREKDPLRPSTRITHSGLASTAAAEHRRTQPAKLAAVLRGDLDWITMKALEKDRTRRYQTANALALDVRRHLNHEPVSAGPPSAAYRTRKFVRRHRVGVAAVTALVMLVLAFTGIMTVQAGRIARERDRANQEATIAKQVSDFLVGLFKVSDPSEARGDTLTAREILANGAKQLDTSLRDQPNVQARLQSTIGAVYTSLGLYGDAQPLLQRALESQRRLLGEESVETLATAHQLANLYWYDRKLDDAERLYIYVLEGRRRLFGEEHPDTLKTKFDLASLYSLEKRTDEAERLTADTLVVQRRVLGPDHPDTLSSMNNLQAIYLVQRRYDEAEPIAKEVLQIRRRVLGEEHPDTLRSAHNLAAIYGNLGRNGEAEPLYARALNGRRRVLGETHPDTLFTQLRLASVFRDQRRYNEAQVVALAAYRGLRDTLGAEHDRTRTAIEDLVKLYEAWGRNESAAEWRARLPKEGALQR